MHRFTVTGVTINRTFATSANPGTRASLVTFAEVHSENDVPHIQGHINLAMTEAVASQYNIGDEVTLNYTDNGFVIEKVAE